jgi:predicted helicase
MTDGHYKDSLEAAKTEMEALLGEQTQIEQRLAYIVSRLQVLRKTILSLGELLGEEFEPEMVGITQAIRKVLRGSVDEKRSYISPIAIRNALQKDDFPLSEYKNALAVIHTTLKRLENQGEIESMTATNGKSYYRWNTDITDEDIPF